MNRVQQIIASAIVALVAVPVASAQIYTVTDLGTLTGTETFGSSVNNLGAAAGSATTFNDIFTHAFSWTKKGGIVDVGSLGGDLSVGNAISDLAVVAGGSQLTGDFQFDAFITTKTGLKDLGTLGGQFSNATGVNALGQVVGLSTLAGEASTHAFYWDSKHGVKDLGTLGGTNSQATAISLLGVTVGSADKADGVTTDAAYWDTKGIHDLGNLGGPGSFALANAVSALGQAVGSSTTAAGDTHAFIATSKGLRDLGTLGGTVSVANGIYPAGGIVVGTATDANDVDNLAFVWTSKTGMVDLNTQIAAGSGWVLQTANGINALGQIVGSGSFNGLQHAFLLTLK